MAKHAFGTKFRKNIEKFNSPTIHQGFEQNPQWCGIGNYAMNKLLSGSYFHAFMYGRSVLIGGESGSGKSLILATAAAEAQKSNDTHIIWVDVENATTESWLNALGVDTAPDKFSPMNASTMGDVKRIIADVVKVSDAEPENDKTNLMIVIDSWSDLLTEKELDEATSGKMVGDQGQAAKQTKNIIKAAGHMVVRRPIIVAGVVHTMESQNKYDPDEKFLGGRGLVYLASIAFLFQKYKLKGEDVNEFDASSKQVDKKVVGTKCKVKLYKSRFTKPNEEVEVQLVYPHGLDPFSGLFNYMREDELIVTAKGLGRYMVKWPEGAVVPPEVPESFTKKQFKGNIALRIMQAVDISPHVVEFTDEELSEDDNELIEDDEDDDNV